VNPRGWVIGYLINDVEIIMGVKVLINNGGTNQRYPGAGVWVAAS
jgi:hypothetical protein|tara:strand:- start:3126 stop:3260 length:135 start_codon:yes stop_codon:yes gene_type:complete